jgi:hypothetical protein
MAATSKFHGGLSTGPKTPEGRARIAEAQRKRWAAWRKWGDLARGSQARRGKRRVAEDWLAV